MTTQYQQSKKGRRPKVPALLGCVASGIADGGLCHLAAFFTAAFLAGAAFLTTAFLAGAAFLTTAFLAAAAFLTTAFLAGAGFLTTAFLAAAAFLTTAFLAAAAFFTVAFLAGAAFFTVAFFTAGLLDAALVLAEARAPAAEVLGSFFGSATTSRNCVPALNFGTAVFLILTLAPVRGLRPILAARSAFSKVPKPVMPTFSPRATVRMMTSSTP